MFTLFERQGLPFQSAHSSDWNGTKCFDSHFFNWPQVSLYMPQYMLFMALYNQQIVITLLNLFFNLSFAVLLFGVHANNKMQGDDIT